MIEKIVLNYLNANLSVPAYMEEPGRAPASYVVIERIAGGMTNRIKSASLAIQSYAGTLYGAASLDETVRGLMDNITSLDSIGSAHIASSYNFTDTTKKKYRYQCTYDFTYYD